MRKIIEQRVNELYNHYDEFRIPKNMVDSIVTLLSTGKPEQRWNSFKQYLLSARLIELIDNKWAWNLYKETL